jgi:hypothetical protein
VLSGSKWAGACLYWRHGAEGDTVAGTDGGAATTNNNEGRAAIDREGIDTEATAAENRQIYI